MVELEWRCPKCNTITHKNGTCPPLCKRCYYFPTILEKGGE